MRPLAVALLLAALPSTSVAQAVKKTIVPLVKVPAGPPPTGLRTGTAPTSIAIHWICPQGASGYDVYGTPAGGSEVKLNPSAISGQCLQDFQAPARTINTVIGGSIQTTYSQGFTHAGLAPGSTYTYVVVALYPDGSLGYSQPVTAVSLHPVPAGLTVTPSGRSARLGWGGLSGTAGYEVHRMVAGQTAFQQVTTTPPTTTSWTDPLLLPPGQHQYFVKAVNGLPGTAATLSMPAWPGPTNVLVTESSSSVTVTWDLVPGVAGGYHVFRQRQGEATFSQVTPTPIQPLRSRYGKSGLSHQDAHPGMGQRVNYYVKAVDGDPSAVASIATTTARRTAFDPMTQGFKFVNDFSNSFIGPPINYTTGGLCGGMSYTVLDYFNASRSVPQQGYRPANNTTLQRYLYGRQVTSLLQNLDKWAETSINPGGARNQEFFNWGLSARLTELRSFLDRGVPVPLGLKGPGGINDGDHQVLAIGYDAGRYQGDLGNYQTDLKIFIYDPNYPSQISTLVPDPNTLTYYLVGNAHKRWRTYFVDGKYTPAAPPVIAAEPVYPNDGLVHMLRFEIRTGADDMRGGADHVDVTVRLSNNTSQYYPNISQNGIWLANYQETVPVVLSQPVPASMITAVEISTNATGGVNGDNWDLTKVDVALIGGGPARWLVSGGSGPHRFTGARIPLVITP